MFVGAANHDGRRGRGADARHASADRAVAAGGAPTRLRVRDGARHEGGHADRARPLARRHRNREAAGSLAAAQASGALPDVDAMPVRVGVGIVGSADRVRAHHGSAVAQPPPPALIATRRPHAARAVRPRAHPAPAHRSVGRSRAMRRRRSPRATQIDDDPRQPEGDDVCADARRATATRMPATISITPTMNIAVAASPGRIPLIDAS